MPVPIPTPIFRIVHVDCLPTVLQRGGLHGVNHCPADGLPYRTIHNVEIQGVHHIRNIPCKPGGTLHDYVPFYFGYLSPMLFQLKTGRVTGYTEGRNRWCISKPPCRPWSRPAFNSSFPTATASRRSRAGTTSRPT
jgi:hypothetical protein